ncbi:MAG: helix-turn-helix transcriptional regulator [Clostridia bacterium]|nr:helix-turn-helix transcriptional regulator [Clostridia bacterium]
MTLKEKLATLISSRQVTLGQISEKTGVTPRTLQNYAKGKTVPKTYEKYLFMCEMIDELCETCPKKREKKWYMKYVRGKRKGFN